MNSLQIRVFDSLTNLAIEGRSFSAVVGVLMETVEAFAGGEASEKWAAFEQLAMFVTNSADILPPTVRLQLQTAIENHSLAHMVELVCRAAKGAMQLNRTGRKFMKKWCACLAE